MKQRHKLMLGTVFLLLSITFIYISRNSHSFSSWYSTDIYPVLVHTIGWFSALVPFSLVEMMLYALIILVCVFCVQGIIYLVQKRTTPLVLIKNWSSNAFLFLSALLFLYTFQCGINYHSATFAQLSGYEKEKYSKEYSSSDYSFDELIILCQYLTEQLNVTAPEVERDSQGLAINGKNPSKEATAAMKNLGSTYPCLSGYYPRPKALFASQILSYQHLSGVYSPFTIEANYNGDMTPYNIPFTACHELAHLKSFMKEDEANFIAYLACVNYENISFQYSGYLLAWIYSTNELHKADQESYQTLLSSLNPLVYEDLKANNNFWSAYDGPTAELSNKVNDTYLKANKQMAGVETYNEMVALLIAYYSSSESFSSISSQM